MQTHWITLFLFTYSINQIDFPYRRHSMQSEAEFTSFDMKVKTRRGVKGNYMPLAIDYCTVSILTLKWSKWLYIWRTRYESGRVYLETRLLCLKSSWQTIASEQSYLLSTGHVLSYAYVALWQKLLSTRGGHQVKFKLLVLLHSV